MKALSSFNALRNSRTIRSRRERTINVNRGALMQRRSQDKSAKLLTKMASLGRTAQRGFWERRGYIVGALSIVESLKA